MTTTCHVDLESYSKTDLRKAGVYRYAEDPSTEVLCLFYAFDDGPVHGWVPYGSIPPDAYPKRVDGTFYVQPQMPADLRLYVESGSELRAHNAGFERTMLNGSPGKKIGFPPTPVEQWVCTAAKAAAHSLPRDLAGACAAIGSHPKDKAGHNIMLQVARPRKPSKDNPETRWTPWNAPQKLQALYDYCADDVRAERGLDQYVPDLSPREQQAFWLDQCINDRGVQVDLESVANARVLIDEYRAALERQCRRLTSGINPTQTTQIAEWIRANGFEIENLQAPTVAEALKDPTIPKDVRTVLRIRSTHAMKAVSKYEAMQKAVCKDGRLRGMFVYHAAGTGRWASKIVQLQNLYRGVLKDPDTAIECYRGRDLQWLRALYAEDPMKVLASTIRGMLVPAAGGDIMALDYGQIEARALAWLAGQQDVLDVFASGQDVYVHAAAKMFGVPREAVDGHQRFLGKTSILACGYQGSKAAFAKMAKNYGVDVPEDFALKIVHDWRRANPKIVQFWYALEEAAREAVLQPGVVFGVAGKKAMFKVEGDFLYMRLPSGRRLAYFKPLVDKDNKITYMGIDTYTRQWCRTSTYGGKIAENCIAEGTLVLTGRGWVPIEKVQAEDTVHDGLELVSHEGLLYKGMSSCIHVDGVLMTPEHEVLTYEGWKAALESPRPYRPALWNACRFSSGPKRKREVVVGVPMRLWKYSGEVRARSHKELKGWPDSAVRMQNTGVPVETEEAWHDQAPRLRSVVVNAGPLPPTNPPGVAQLRRERNTCRPKVGGLRGILEGHGSFLQTGAIAGSRRQQQGVLEEKLPMDYPRSSMQQQTRERSDTYTVGAFDGGAGVEEIRGRCNNNTLSDSERMGEQASAGETRLYEPKRKVYDILNCGPRHRFVVLGEEGPFIVHNCTQAMTRDIMLNGMFSLDRAGYGIIGTVHDEVLLETPRGSSSVEEAASLMCELPAWAEGLPVKAEGFRALRYRKD